MRAVLFDMDGVLVDSEDYWVTLEREELLPQVVPDQDVAVAEITGMNYREIYDYLDAEYETAVSREEFLDLFETAAETLYRDRVALLEGTHDLLDELEERGVPRAIVSSSPHDWIDIVLKRFDLADRFDAVVSAEEIDGPGKPEPDVFEYAAAELGVEPGECVVLEDSEHGIRAAARAGTTCIAYEIEAHDDVDYSPADAVVDSPLELRDAVLERVQGAPR
ncbi:HAD family hydrolase [Natronosalvus rutilus]|uniref:HAD family phosphatase n=1 Tax=Natronosalvus rutilus TaxID=2953753 RepID=A0A9E7NCB7_9EURY|nr:HAD family phosphatase [Natronosalvus rutilus]UTF54335.1 HAD family phosphatase [Natronosalvus rutilus]